MYWDIVEVIPKSDHSLFVRFKDGTSGLVRLREKQLTGALEPLRDERFFEKVFIRGIPVISRNHETSDAVACSRSLSM